uniref:Kynurenine 3-monooxygenase n=1 Tax=Panagrolaimus sp. JU765 TaxID=591449 RepID=A0AC34Q523_9BILA
MPKVLIAGAGLVGALNACFFAKKGWHVEVYEFRKDIRTMEHVQGRSINLALSHRGKSALEAVGLKDYIVTQGVKMFARLVHDQDGKTTHRQPYGQPGEHIVSINRRHLNEVMITEAEKYPNVKFYFEHKVIKADPKKGTLTVNFDGTQFDVDGDMILACDGAYSAVRRSLMAYPLFQFSQEYIAHGYVELNILPKNNDFALAPNVFHLWPRGDFTLIALANKDKTFTVTIFAPYKLFEEEMYDEKSVLNFFQKQFPDAFHLLGEKHIAETFARVKPQPLVSIKCSPHSFDKKVVLMGDAAHAMVPFYGQGMNAGFEDCLVLSEILDEFHNDIESAVENYSKRRVVDAHCIIDLAMYNYNEMSEESRVRTDARNFPESDNPAVPFSSNPNHFQIYFSAQRFDAAHAMVPFYGQGMNAGFEDCLVLSEILDEFHNDIESAVENYSKRRVVDAHCIIDLAMYNYNELKDLVNKTPYKIRKRFDLFLNRWFPESWIPLYSMVTFTRTPYHKVIQKRSDQDRFLSNIGKFASLMLLTAAGYAFWQKRTTIEKVFDNFLQK